MHDPTHPEPPDLCTCQACKFGLWCANGRRGEFVRGVDECKLCGVVAWKHSSTKNWRGAR